MTVDGLKSSRRKDAKVKGKYIGELAREAIRWAQDGLQSDNGSVIGQRKDEMPEENAIGDDAILACCLYDSASASLMNRYVKAKNIAPVTLLTNDNNLSIKAEANGIIALSSTRPTGEGLSSDLLLRQALHGPFALDKTFHRPKEGNDTCMLDLSGTMEENLKFLPSLKESRHAPKSAKENKPDIAIDPETGVVVLVKDGEKLRTTKSGLGKYSQMSIEEGIEGSNGVKGVTYADIMASAKDSESHHGEVDEMDWE
jgi:hypothetical protein